MNFPQSLQQTAPATCICSGNVYFHTLFMRPRRHVKNQPKNSVYLFIYLIRRLFIEIRQSSAAAAPSSGERRRQQLPLGCLRGWSSPSWTLTPTLRRLLIPSPLATQSPPSSAVAGISAELPLPAARLGELVHSRILPSPSLSECLIIHVQTMIDLAFFTVIK